jgi:FlaA1/EpsC-like NDP-sugar epimerase
VNKQTLLKTLIRSRYVNRWVVFLCDLALSLVSTLIVLLFISYVRGCPFTTRTNLFILSLAAVGSIIAFFFYGTYRGIIRHSTISEAGRLGAASLTKGILIFVGILLLPDELTLRVVLTLCVFDAFFTFFCFVCSRVVFIQFYHLLINNVTSNRESLLIFIGEDTTTSLSGSLFNRLGHYQVEGYLRIGSRTSMRIGEYSVYSVDSYQSFCQLVDQKQTSQILFVTRRDVENEKERLIRYCEKKKVRMLMMPPVDELVDGKPTNRTLPELRIEDLLGRDEISINNLAEVFSEFTGKTILVTGAAGSIGSELCRQLAQMNIHKLVMFDSAETPLHNLRLEFERDFPELSFVPVIGDVRVVERVRMVFETYHPQIVFHAAAYKHVPLMEENPCEAVLVNVQGTRQVADMALHYGAEKMIMISTDKAVNPTNVMGCSKRLAEIYVQSLGCAIKDGKVEGHTKFITTRFGNVLGSNGSVIPRFREQIQNGGPVTVTHPDIIRFFMTIPEACRLVLEAATMGQGNEIFVFDMGKPVKILDLARRMIELAGFVPDEDIPITFTGLRPGEKLFEEVLSKKEDTLDTPNKKIRIAKVREYNYFDILADYDRFADLSRRVKIIDTVKLMKEVVPEYKSRNSKFEELDNCET